MDGGVGEEWLLPLNECSNEWLNFSEGLGSVPSNTSEAFSLEVDGAWATDGLGFQGNLGTSGINPSDTSLFLKESRTPTSGTNPCSPTAAIFPDGFGSHRRDSGHIRANLSYRTETRTKTVFICTYKRCTKTFARIYDLRRHHLSIHERVSDYPCSFIKCPRFIRPFVRKDKRDAHERGCKWNPNYSALEALTSDDIPA